MKAAKAASAAAALRDHLLTNESAGAIIVSTVLAEGHSIIETRVLNASRSHAKLAAEQLCEFVITQLEACDCGRDHTHEISQVEGARRLLAASVLPVLN